MTEQEIRTLISNTLINDHIAGVDAVEDRDIFLNRDTFNLILYSIDHVKQMNKAECIYFVDEIQKYFCDSLYAKTQTKTYKDVIRITTWSVMLRRIIMNGADKSY